MNNSNIKESIIIGSQLRQARELLQLTLEEAAQEIKVSPQDVGEWEKEKLRPNLRELEELAKLYGREIDYFLRKTPSPPEKIEFRGKPEQSLKELSRETKIVLARFDELCRTALEFEKLLNRKREVKLPHLEETDRPEIAAQGLRKKFDVGDKPLPDLRNRLENEGVRIFELPVPEDAFSGFSFWHTEYGPSILLNAKESKGRRNFTLAHELAHLLYGQGTSLCYIPSKISIAHGRIEYKANQLAIELLLPESGVMEDFRKKNFSTTPSEDELAQMAYYKWGVSIQALGYRLENLALVKKGHIDTLLETRPKYFRPSKTPSWERRLGKPYVETSIETHRKGFISLGKLASSLGITVRKTVEEVEKRAKRKS